MNKTVLITGASGAIANAVAGIMIESGFSVNMLSRSVPEEMSPPSTSPQVQALGNPGDLSAVRNKRIFYWDPKSRKIDTKCFEGVFAILHLAGEPIFGQPWTSSRRQRILSSRVDSIEFLVKSIPSWQLPYVKVLVSASATGYYPANLSESLVESSPAGGDFLADVCHEWEHKVRDLAHWGGFREVRFRNGVVLDSRSGVYKKLALLTKWGLASIPGNGLQKMPWVHIDDVGLAIKSALLDQNWAGPYNMVAPEVASMLELCEGIASSLNKRIIIPPLPGWFLKGLMGDMSSLLLDSYTVLPERLLKNGFDFRYPTLAMALADLRNTRI